MTTTSSFMSIELAAAGLVGVVMVRSSGWPPPRKNNCLPTARLQAGVPRGLVKQQFRAVDGVAMADAPQFPVEVHACERKFIDTLDGVELDRVRFRHVRRFVELQALVRFPLARLAIDELAVADLRKGHRTDRAEAHLVAVEPAVEILSVVLRPDLVGHACARVAK